MSTKRKKKEDTWTELELTKALEKSSVDNKKSRDHRGKERKRNKRNENIKINEHNIKENIELKKHKEKHKTDENRKTKENRHAISESRKKLKDEHVKKHQSKKERVKDKYYLDAKKETDYYETNENKKKKYNKERNEYSEKGIEFPEKRYNSKEEKHGSQKEKHKSREKRNKSERNRQKSNEEKIKSSEKNYEFKEKQQKIKDSQYLSKLNNDNYDDQLKLSKNNISDGNKPDSVDTKNSYSINASEDYDEYNYDDDDFEDYYESDFEDDINDEESLEKLSSSHSRSSTSLNNNLQSTLKQQEMQDLIKAINQENERVASSKSLRNNLSHQQSESDLSSKSSSIAKTPPKFTFSTAINFTDSKNKLQANTMKSIVLKRRDDLLPHIQLDVHSFDLFEIKPVTEYNFYIQTFGTTNTRQIATQSNDDAVAVEIQTDEVELIEKWQQHPQDGPFASGGEYVSNTKVKEVDEYSKIKSMFEDDNGNFINFIRHSSCLVEINFTEADVLGKSKSGCKSEFNISDTYIDFDESPFITNRKLCFCLLCDDKIIQAYTPAKSSDDNQQIVSDSGLIYIRSSFKHQQRERFFICDGIPTAGFYSSLKQVLFVGTADGIVLAYDLNEPSEIHSVEGDLVYKLPTYTTAWIENCHTSSIVSVDSVASFDKSNQIFSLDESSSLIVWVFVENVSTSDDDKGLSPLAVVKLVKNISTETNCFQFYEGQATCAVCPDSNTFYIGNDMGEVVCRNRDKILKVYEPRYGISKVVSVSCNVYLPSLILVGYQNGIISIFTNKSSSPLMNWKLENCNLKYCHWSNVNPSLFFVLDNKECISIFDLFDQSLSPFINDHSNKKISQMCINSEIKKNANLLVSYTDGSFDLHEISKKLRSFTEANIKQLEAFVSSILF